MPAPLAACDSLSMILSVPFQSQTDNASGKGWRECFTSSVAMLLMTRGKVANDDAYAKIRSAYGDTTIAASHLKACAALGVKPVYLQTMTRQALQGLIIKGFPVAVGWLHHGPPSAPIGGGHWSVVIGLHAQGVLMHDPFGEANLLKGGHIAGREGRQVPYSWRNWGPRWEVQGPGTGWAFYLSA